MKLQVKDFVFVPIASKRIDPRVKSLSIILLLFLIYRTGKAQVEHNYPVDPKNVNCDSLLIPMEFTAAFKIIESTSWRYRQSLSIRRQYGLRQAKFYSCDALTGYLVTVADNKKCIFKNVPLKNWEELTESADPDGFVVEVLEKNFTSICKKTD